MGSAVSCAAGPPATGRTKICGRPAAVLEKAIRVPSGENVGEVSLAAVSVTCREPLPLVRTNHRTRCAPPPGVGKTTFAVHAMHRLAHRYPDGWLFVNLGGGTSEQVLGRVLVALGVAEQQLPSDVEARSSLCRAMLRGRKMAMLLDNAVDEGQVRPLLPSSRGCLVLVTSRRCCPGWSRSPGYRWMCCALRTWPSCSRRSSDGPGRTRSPRLCGEPPNCAATCH